MIRQIAGEVNLVLQPVGWWNQVNVRYAITASIEPSHDRAADASRPARNHRGGPRSGNKTG